VPKPRPFPTPTWETLQRLREASKLPVVVKGVLTAEDTELTVKNGLSGVIVSNHGARQLDQVGSTIDALPECVKAAAEKFPFWWMVVSAAARTSLRLRAGCYCSWRRASVSVGTRGVRTERRGAGHGDLASGVSCRYGNGGGRQNLTDRSLVRPHSCMMVRSRARLIPVAAIGLICGLPSIADDETGKILRPANNSSHTSGPIDLSLTALSGKLQMDGIAIEVEAALSRRASRQRERRPGMHSLVLVWEGGKKEVHFLLVRILPRTFNRFHQHPPIAGVQCTQCHGLNRRGRFVFKVAVSIAIDRMTLRRFILTSPPCSNVAACAQPTWIYGEGSSFVLERNSLQNLHKQLIQPSTVDPCGLWHMPATFEHGGLVSMNLRKVILSMAIETATL